MSLLIMLASWVLLPTCLLRLLQLNIAAVNAALPAWICASPAIVVGFANDLVVLGVRLCGELPFHTCLVWRLTNTADQRDGRPRSF